MELLASLENNGLAIWLRESPSVLGYPTLLAFHTFGMAFLVGTSVAIALRVLGIASGVPLAPLTKFFPLMQVAFAISLVSGALLLMLDLTLFLTMGTFYIKLLAIVAALIFLRLLRARVLSAGAGEGIGSAPTEAQILAGAMLLSWVIAITAGRLTAYAAYIGWQSAAAVLVLAVILLVGRSIALRFWGANT
ncbi:MAG: hypothetical protein V3V86_00235 [Gammaproteobacteria bacterium]